MFSHQYQTHCRTQVIYAYIFMNDALSLIPHNNISNIVIEIRVHDYIIQLTFQIFSIMISPIVCLTYRTRGFQTGLVRAGRGHNIGRLEFR